MSCRERESSRTFPRSRTARRFRHGVKCCRYRGVQAQLADRLYQQHHPGQRDRPAATALDADTRVQPDTLAHLENASFRAADRTLNKSHRCRSGALSAYLIKHRTIHLVKARG